MVLMFTTRHAPVTPPMKEKSRAFISLPTSFVGLTLALSGRGEHREIRAAAARCSTAHSVSLRLKYRSRRTLVSDHAQPDPSCLSLDDLVSARQH